MKLCFALGAGPEALASSVTEKDRGSLLLLKLLLVGTGGRLFLGKYGNCTLFLTTVTDGSSISFFPRVVVVLVIKLTDVSNFAVFVVTVSSAPLVVGRPVFIFSRSVKLVSLSDTVFLLLYLLLR